MIPAKMICGIFVIIAIKCISEVFFWSLLVTNLHRRQQPVAAAGLRVGQMLKSSIVVTILVPNIFDHQKGI